MVFSPSQRQKILLQKLLMVLLLLSFISMASAQQQQDPTTINGGSILAMAGKNSVAVAVDKRFGSGPQMVNIAPRHVLILPKSNVIVAFVGLEGDVQSLSQDIQTEVSSRLGRALGFGLQQQKQEKKRRRISPRAIASIASHLLHRNRGGYYVEPIVLGLSDSSSTTKNLQQQTKQKPFLCAMDMIGAQSFSKSFVCSGAASTSLYGTAEQYWKPDLSPNELAEVCARAFQSALERDCLSGYGAIVYLITDDGIVELDLASRND